MMPLRTVSQIASLGGITVRTLHHYDEIGLLQPSGRTEAGYRLYDDAALVRLHDILLWRSLGFPLEEVRALVDDSTCDPREALVLHRERLVSQIGALNQRVADLDEAIRKTLEQEEIADVDLKALFDGFDPAEFEEEAEARWGGTDAWVESKRRTRGYRDHDWLAIKAEAEQITERYAALFRAGVSPTDPQAAAAAAAQRAHISRWFYTVTAEIHLGLAHAYVADDRFRQTYDAICPGLAVFVRDAIRTCYAPRRRRL